MSVFRDDKLLSLCIHLIPVMFPVPLGCNGRYEVHVPRFINWCSILPLGERLLPKETLLVLYPVPLCYVIGLGLCIGQHIWRPVKTCTDLLVAVGVEKL